MTITLQPIKQRIIDTYIQTWSTGLYSSRRLCTYRRFKTDFTLETYLDNIPNKKHRIALSKFSLDSHTLEIERGRYTNLEREQRKCKFCNTNSIANEYHFYLCAQFILN